MGVILKVVQYLILIQFVHNACSITYTHTPTPLISYSIPDKRAFKKSLGFIEDTYLNFTELTTKYNYPIEEHSVTTQDGYILTIFRIFSKCEVTKGYPIVLMHGIYDTSDEWILTGPQTGLGYVLANNCYDVWTANHRGNVYSRRHVSLNPDEDPEYWNYTFDEHGNFDLPAIVDHVLLTTQLPKVNYIGHSQGTTDFFVMASLRPEYNEKIQMSFHLSPVAWMRHIMSPLPRLIAPKSRFIKDILVGAGFSELLAKQHITHAVVEFLCQFAPDEICGTAFALATGYRRGNISPRNLKVAFGHLFAGISAKDLDHFGQLVSTGKFQRYDEGRKGNIRRYGSISPPEYNVSQITSAVVLICAKNDWVSSLKDINILSSKLPNLLEKYVVPDPSWSHNDHVFGVNAPKYVNSKILEYLTKYNS